MIAELINEYYEEIHNQRPFYYKGWSLPPDDCSNLKDNEMENGDIVLVGKGKYY